MKTVEKLEVVCNVNIVKNVIAKLREIHPYEEPAIDIIPLIDENIFDTRKRYSFMVRCQYNQY